MTTPAGRPVWEEAREALWDALHKAVEDGGPLAKACVVREAERLAKARALRAVDELTTPELGLCCPADAEFVAAIRRRIEEGQDE